MTSESENNKKLKEFFGKEYHSLKAYVNSKIKASVNRDAEDIIQDVALKLFSGADRYSPINNVAGFVYHSIKNKIIDIMRMNKQVISPEDENEAKLIEFTEILYDKSDNSYSEQMKVHELEIKVHEAEMEAHEEERELMIKGNQRANKQQEIREELEKAIERKRKALTEK